MPQSESGSLILALEPNSSTPLYLQVYTEIREKIISGTLLEGFSLPSERRLAQDLKISRVTLRMALELLEQEELLRRRHGSGTYVAKKRIVQPLSSLSSFSDDMRSRGLKPGGKLLSLERVRPSPQEALHLALKPTADIWRIRRLRTANDQALGIEISSLPCELLGEMRRSDVENTSLYGLLRSRSLFPARAIQHLRATACEGETSTLLELPVAAPILATERITWDELGRALEYVRGQYRGDRYDFVVELDQGQV
jgi:GntR family transcriptional regulator